MAIKSDAPQGKDHVQGSNGVEIIKDGAAIRQMPVTLLSGFLVLSPIPFSLVPYFQVASEVASSLGMRNNSYINYYIYHREVERQRY